METLAERPRRRIDALDIAKGIGMLLVVLGHSEPPKLLRYAIFAFHMPLFFMVSGMVYRKKRRAAVADLIHLILPYVATVAVVLLFQLLRTRAGMTNYYASTRALLKSAWFGSGTDHEGIRLIGEIWFLVALFWSRRLMDGLFCLDKLWARALCAAVLAGLGMALVNSEKWYPMSMDVALFGAGFMLVGWLIANRTDLLTDEDKLWPVLLACALVYWVGCTRSRLTMSGRRYGDLWIALPTAVAGSLGTVSLSRLLEKVKPIKAFLAFIGRHSLLFLCIHTLDWRMPFPYWGGPLVEPYAGRSWYWVLVTLRRFSFDFAVMCVVVLLAEGARRMWRRKRPAA